ncbi:multiubiquitin domain-containing protein [Streptomyces cinerochromogenes]|uniref:multiubiquitin domain-containing protein n=1 Tax=Streptomyces cinerochromogenes TaxID=66422 RepID=UPI0036AC7376
MTSSNEVAADAAPPRPHTVTVTVNGRPVVLPDHEATGLEIKRAAIAQGLPIDEGFQLSVRQGNGRYQVVDDNEPVHVHTHQEFLAVPPDDNS